MDEAASRLRMQVDSKPEALDEIDRRLVQLRIEVEALKKEKDEASKTRNAEKAKLASATDVKEELDRARFELQDAVRRGDYETAGRLQHEDIPALEAKVEELETQSDTPSLASETVTSETIATIVSRWTGVPIEKMLEGEREKLLNMEEVLAARVIGQDRAVEAVSDAVRRARAGLRDPQRPIGSFIFLGPTMMTKPSRVWICRNIWRNILSRA